MTKSTINESSQEKQYLSKNAQLIEKVLDAFGITTRVVDLKTESKYYEYQLEVVVGTDLAELESHCRDLALALASPTGKVEMIIPIPGRSLVGVRVPKPSQKELNAMKFDESETIVNSKKESWRGIASIPFYLLAYGCRLVGDKISNESTDREDKKDTLLEEAKTIIAQYDNASASLLQRKLKIGYARSARILDELCEDGYVGEARGSMPRKVLKKDDRISINSPNKT